MLEDYAAVIQGPWTHPVTHSPTLKIKMEKNKEIGRWGWELVSDCGWVGPWNPSTGRHNSNSLIDPARKFLNYLLYLWVGGINLKRIKICSGSRSSLTHQVTNSPTISQIERKNKSYLLVGELISDFRWVRDLDSAHAHPPFLHYIYNPAQFFLFFM
jgi:hypothetical protein